MRRVTFVITSRAQGTGGHMHSLRDITDALAPHLDARIICVCTTPPPALKGARVPVEMVDYRPEATPRVVAQLYRRLRAQGAEWVHAFDPLALKLALPAADALSLRVVLTLCGGPTPRRDLPAVDDIVLFSQENLRGLQANPRMRGTRMRLVPNRVRAVEVDAEAALARGAALRAHLSLPADALLLLRINRMSAVYAPVMHQTLALARALRERGLPVRAALVGSPNDPRVVDEVTRLAGSDDAVVTSPEFTHRAAELTPAADAVVGTGRGLMEAASAGRPLFTPIAGHTLPALLDANNFEALHDTNFSPRNRLETSDAALLEAADAALRTAAARAAAGAFSRHVFETRFDVRAAIVPYLEVYASAPRRRPWQAPLDVGRLAVSQAVEATRVALAARSGRG
jgi:hypothetical protein